MEMFAIMFAIIFLLFIIATISVGEFIPGGFWFLVGLIVTQVFWIPSILPIRIDVQEYISDSYENMVFEKPVRIVKTRTYKPGSVFFDDTEIEIYFTDVCGTIK